MNKKGFTLTELLAVIAIISIISLIAIPNIVNISENIKKDNMLNDAKRFISLAKLMVNSNYDIRESNTATKFYINELNSNGDFNTEMINNEKKIIDKDGYYYDNSSYVEYNKSSGTAKYCIYLVGEKRHLAKTGESCIDEKDLSSREIVHDNN